MKIVIVHKSSISSFPPILSLIDVLFSLGVEIHIICGEDNSEFLSDLRTKCKEIHVIPYSNYSGKIGKIITWLNVRKKFWSLIIKHSYEKELIWIPTADTTLALGKKLLKYRFILNIYELFDTFPRYKNGLEIFAKRAKVVVCPEITRAHIFKSWWNLKDLPVVLPNKPYFINREKFRPLPSEIQNIINKIKESNKKIAIYQGILTQDRGLDSLCKAFNFNKNFALILMGKETKLSKQLLINYPNIFYIPFILPPYHLNITSHANIGVLSYDNSSLNNIFCAPNKIWEYSGIGLPMLGNEIPGLINVIENKKIGKTVNFEHVDRINEALDELDKKYESYCENSYNFFDSVDIKDVIQKILIKAM